MNEKVNIIIWIIVCYGLAIVVFFAAKLYGKRRADKNSERARDLNERAGEDNRSLGEKERRTQELIERQADDYRTAERNNRRAKELIGKAKDILADNN